MMVPLIFCILFSASSGADAKWIFNFTRSLYLATIPENARGRVYAIPQNGRMGVYIPFSLALWQPSTENGTLFRQSPDQQQHQSLVRFRIVSGDKHNFFKAESEMIGDFAYLRIRTRSSLDVDLNRDLTPEYSLRVKAVYRRRALGVHGGLGRNLETRTEVLLKVTDQNDLSPVFLPEHYRAKLHRRTPMFSSLVRMTASDADYGLNGEVYYQLMNRTDFFSIHPTSGVVSLIRPVSMEHFKNMTLSIAAVDRASRLFADSRSNQALANLATVDIELNDESPVNENSWTITTAANGDQTKFGQCGWKEDTLCAIVNFSIEKRSPAYLEIEDNSNDDSSGLFYLQPFETRGQRGIQFEIRSVTVVPVGFYNLKLSPFGSTLMLNVTASEWAPSCNSYSDIWMGKTEFNFHIPEWAPDGSFVGHIRLHPDSGVTPFELKKTEDESEKKWPFYITPETGMLYVNWRRNESGQLDFEKRLVYEFYVHVRRALCSPELEEKRKIVVKVKDCNDHAPKFVDTCDTINLGSRASSAGEFSLCKFVAKDEDAGENGRVSYDLIETKPSSVFGLFHIDHSTGELNLRNSSAILFTGDNTYTITIRAWDHGRPLIRYTEKSVVINFGNTSQSKVGNDRKQKRMEENKHSPTVAPEWKFEVSENAQIGHRIGKIEASDMDHGYAGVLLFTIDTDDQAMVNERPFDIDVYNGTIFVFQALDRERKAEYLFRVSISDLGSPSRRVFTKVIVKVLDVNDNAPKFDKSAYRIRVKENTAPGVAVLQVKSTDEDAGENGRVKYALVTRTPYFKLDSTLGMLTLTGELDREKMDRHRLLVQAEDYGRPPLSSLVNVTVVVDDVNDNPPSCRSEYLKASVPEDYPAGALVSCVDADDPDIGESGRISYRLAEIWPKSNSVNDAPFTIDAETGCIRLSWTTETISEPKYRKSDPSYLKLVLDYERQPFYNLTIELSDFGNPRPLKSICHVFIEVVDVNENRFPPKFLSFNTNGDDDDEDLVFAVEAEVYENEPAPTFVKQLKAIDPDAALVMADPKPIYSIIDGDGLGLFTIDQDGRIFTGRSLDHETKPFYWLTVMAQDRAAAPLSTSVDVFIRVLDRNDNPPVPSKPIYYASVMENSPPNVVVLRVEATDADYLRLPVLTVDGEEDTDDEQEFETVGQTQTQTHETFQTPAPLTFKITRGDPQSFFKLDAKTGYISTHRRMIDRETTPELELEVTISDNAKLEPMVSTVTVVVRVEDENDNAPVFPTKMMNYEIPERNKHKRGKSRDKNKATDFLCRVFAYDEDDGKNGEIRYSIMEGNEQNLVRIDAETGNIFAMENAIWNGSQTIILKIRATDSGVPAKFTERHVHLTVVSNELEENTSDLKSLTITSNLVTNPLHVAASDPLGHRVGLLEASLTGDADGQRIWFYLLGGNEDNAFALRPDTGLVLLAKRPSLPTYNLTVFATVDGKNGVTSQATIIVQPANDDDRPEFSVDRIVSRIPENQRVNTGVVRLSEYLKSSGGQDEIRYFLSESYYHNGSHGFFQVDPKSGVIYLKQSLDRERKWHYAFKVGARSRRGKRGYVMVDVQLTDVNDHPPKFVNRHIQLRIAQTTAPGTVVHQLAAFDADEGVNGRLAYSLTLDSHQDTFAIDTLTGALRLIRSMVTMNPGSVFVLAVKVEDGGQPPLFDTADVRVVLIPNGDATSAESVRFTKDTYTFRISERLRMGALLGHVQADGPTGVEYGIVEDAGGYFDIHPITGAITLRRSGDFEHSSHLEATLKARGHTAATAVTGMEDTARLVVTLSDGNDHPPVFKQLYYETAVEEDTPMGTVLLTVQATDEDTGQAGVVAFHLVDQWASEYVQVDYHTGAVRLVSPLDYERPDQRKLEFRVTAEDLGDPKMHAMVPTLVEITVLDVNDEPPRFDQNVYEFVVHTPAVAGTKMGVVKAIDPDTVGDVRYAVVDWRTCWQLRINKTTGMVTLSPQWNDKKVSNANEFSCQISATDGVHQTEAMVKGKLVPYVTPSSGFRFEKDCFELDVEESTNLEPDTALIRFRLLGVPPDEPISFRLLNCDGENCDDDNAYFLLNQVTGVFSTTPYTKQLDREVSPSLMYVVEARKVREGNQATPARTVVNIRVLDKNDNQPKFVGVPYVIILADKTKENSTVFRVKAVDADDGANGKVKYSLSGGKRNPFRIDEDSGEIRLMMDLDWNNAKELKDLVFNVIGTDSGIPQLSTSSPVSIRLVSASTPTFPQRYYNGSVVEGPNGVGTVLMEPNAFGVWSAQNAVVGYIIADSSDRIDDVSCFDLDFATGRLVLQKPLIRKQPSVIPLTVRVRDYSWTEREDNLQAWSEAVVMVNVLDYNDHPPIFEQAFYVVNVSENASLSKTAPLLTLKANDEDDGDNAQFVFFIKNDAAPRTEDYFRLDPNSGTLVLSKRLDFETKRRHTLTVVVKDFGTPSLSSTAKVLVNVLDVNDNPPSFTQQAFNAELPSSKWPAGQFVGQALASDPDEIDSGRLRYSIFNGNDGEWFSIDEKSGVLRTARSATTESVSLPSNEYSLNLTVTDGAYSASCRYLIKIRPGSLAGVAKFSKNLYQARVKESASVGTFVTEIRIDDNAGGLLPALRYRLVGSSLFRMEETTGKIFTSRRLGPREKAVHSLTIIAEKWTDFTVVAHTQLQVAIVSENNRPPKFLAERFFTTVTSQTKPNTIILKIRAADLDRDDILEYSFDSKSSATFEEYFFLDSNTGALAVRRNLESISGTTVNVDIRVTDRGNPPQRTTASLEIRIINEAPPPASFTSLEYIFTIREDADAGTQIGQIDTTRQGRSGEDVQNYRFSLVSQRASVGNLNWISLSETSGHLRVAERMDRELAHELQFYVSLSRTGSKQILAMTLVRILIEDVDDSGPVFENALADEPMVVNVAEDAPVGSVVTMFAASDKDSGDAGRVSYWIQPWDTTNPPPFKIDSTTGWLRTAGQLDRETRDQYNFKIIAASWNSAELRAELNVTVKIADANDQKPTFVKREYNFRLDSGVAALPGLVIGRVAAVDSDLPPNNEIGYFVVGGNELGLYDVRNTGEIYLSKRLEGDKMAVEYRLMVLATDGLFEDTTFVNITLPEESLSLCHRRPTPCPKWPVVEVSEDVAVGMVVTRLNGLAPGQMYRLVLDDPSKGNEDFEVKENGEVIVSGQLDYEKRNTYNIDIGIFHKGGSSVGRCDEEICIVRLTISVLDVNDCSPEFQHDSIPNEISILENYNGTLPVLIGRARAVDADSGLAGRVRYKLNMDDGNEAEEEDLFSIDPNAGALFVWRPLDRERRDRYNLTVIAVDGGQKALSSQKTINVKVLDVNDNPPVFVQRSYDVSAPEDTPVGVVLLQVEAFSADAGENAVITYSLEKSEQASVFEINEKTGEVTLHQPLDYETVKEYGAVAIATDSGDLPLSSTVNIRLGIIDVNDNDPTFERRHYSAKIQEDTAIGSRLVRVLATDVDSGKNGLIGYRIEPTNKYFQISDDQQEAGWITLAHALDYEKATRHEFQVVAYDHGLPPRSAVAVVTVEVLDVNDNAPRILNCNRSVVVKARLPISIPITTFHVTDADGPLNGRPFQFSVLPTVDGQTNQDQPLFKLDHHGGLYALHTPLELPEYFIKVSVGDSGDPPLTSQCRLHIRVTEESRFPPRLVNTSFMVLSYMGEMNSGGVVGRVLALDDDPKDSVRYSISNVNKVSLGRNGYSSMLKEKDSAFMIDPDDGRISAASELPSGEYTLNVSATDGRFDTFALVPISIRSISAKMLDSAVSLRIAGQSDTEERNGEGRIRHGSKVGQSFDERVFVEHHLKVLMRAVAAAVNARSSQFVHVLSVQKAEESIRVRRKTKRKRWWRRESTGRGKRSLGQAVDVLIAVQKSNNHDYFKPEYVRKTLEQKLEEMERKAGVVIGSVVTETCRPDRCSNGGTCRERLHLYEMVNNAILTESFSFVSPTHKRWAECVCADGLDGQLCEREVNECAKRPCPVGHVCVPVEVDRRKKMAGESGNEPAGHKCICTGAGCPAYDSVHLMSPRSWIKYTLSENLETEMRFSVTFRTMARSGTLLYSGGETDFQSLELFGGQIRYRYDLGDGETLVYVPLRPSVDDGLWHTVRIERIGRTATLTLDEHDSQAVNASGGSFVLNLHGASVHLGSNEAAGPGGFVGCLKEAILNEDVLPFHGPGVRMFHVNVGKCTDDDFKRIVTTEAGAGNACGWCLNNGTCVSGNEKWEDSWSCLCPPPFTGLRCESLVTKLGPSSGCLSSPCRNGATCVADPTTLGGYRCQCAPHYTGRTCSVFGGDPCASNPCANGGVCKKMPPPSGSGGIGFYCNCTAGWNGPLCRQPTSPAPNMVSGLFGITLPELIGIVAIFLVLVLLTVVIVLLCRRQRSFKRKKLLQRRGPGSGVNNQSEREPMFSESDVTPSAFAQRSLAGQVLVTGGPCGAMVIASDPNSSITALSPAACSAPGSFGNGSNGPPPLPPRSRGFQPHRGSKLSNLESALSTGIPTVQVRPLSMSERQGTPVEGAMAGGYLETAANYGSAAEELERLGRRASPSFEDLEDWKAALNRMNADSLEKLKVAAGISDDQWQHDSASGHDGGSRPGPPSSTGENSCSPAVASGVRRRPEDERASGRYHWDYSDWNSTLGQHAAGGKAAAGPYGTLSHLSVATDDEYGGGTLPRGVCRLEDTDSEYAGNESGNEDTSDPQSSSRLRGDEFTKEIMALTRSFGRKKIETSGSEDGSSSSKPTLSTFKDQDGSGSGETQSYLDRYLPRPVEPPNSSASERKLLLSQGGETSADEPSSAVLDDFSDGDEDDEYTTPSAVCDPTMLHASNISDVGGGASSDGERSTDSVVPAAGASVKRENSTLIVCSISDDDEEERTEKKYGKSSEDAEKSGNNNNRTFVKTPKKQTQV